MSLKDIDKKAMDRCTQCKHNLYIHRFVKCSASPKGYRRICKKCHSKVESERRKRIGKEELREKAVKLYYKNKDKYNSVKDPHDEAVIHRWIVRNRHRRGLKSGNVRRLDYDVLRILIYEALDLFPYMVFRRIDGPRAFSASIDRIDSKKGYTEDNVVVIPLWVNSAKLDLEWTKMQELMKAHLDNDDFIKIFTKEENNDKD